MKLNLYDLTINRRPIVMGILNVTPDSFSDGGRYTNLEGAVQRALEMIAEGAAIIDIGGESSRPGAEPVPIQEELDRVIPVIKALRAQTDIPISIDTVKADVMNAAVAAGADIINDIYALRGPNALEAAAQCEVPICLMHMLGTPQTMQKGPNYQDVVMEVKAFLQERIEACLAAGVKESNLMIDPGIGFGKTVEHNLTLIAELEEFLDFKLPILMGVSRKSMIGKLLDRDTDERLAGGLALALFCIQRGTHIIRTHDVKETVDVLRMHQTLNEVLSHEACLP